MSESRWPEMDEAADLMEEEGRRDADIKMVVLAQWLRTYNYHATHTGSDPYPSLPLVIAREYLRERKG